MDNQITTLFSNRSAGMTESVYSLDNYEIAKVKNTSSAHNPTVTFNRSHVYVNAELLKRTPDMVHAQLLINRAAKKLILRPCDKRERDAVRLRTMSEVTTKPRHILCDDFSARLFRFMQWDRNCRYKVLGNLINSAGETLAVFDLTAADKFEQPTKGEARPQASAVYETHSQVNASFGATIEKHLANPLISHFREDTVISVDNQETAAEPEKPSYNEESTISTEI
jgi:hypothetical protein